MANKQMISDEVGKGKSLISLDQNVPSDTVCPTHNTGHSDCHLEDEQEAMWKSKF